jgi:hypothetical protein
MHCKSGQSVLNVSDISGYDKNGKDHIIFLNFKIRDQGRGRNEKVTLVNATSGNGRFKGLMAPVHYPYQIHVVPRYNNTSQLGTELIFEHPLFRSVEVASQNGTMSQSSLTASEGILSMRMQEDRAMESIELYSITPDRGKVKIYTLHLKQ